MVIEPADARRLLPPLTAKEKQLVQQGVLLPRDLRWKLDEEREVIRLFAEARLKELTGIVEAYEAGSLTWAQAEKRWDAYLDRWDVPFTNDKELGKALGKQAFENSHGYKLDWEGMDGKRDHATREEEKRGRKQQEKRSDRS
jgi:hypothetical protein